MLELTPGQALKLWVKANGISVKEFAEKMGYTYACALHFTSGSANVTPDMIIRMERVYGRHEAERISRHMPKIEA